MECEFHILFVTLLTKRTTCAQLHYFHKMQNAVLILSQVTQERIARNRSCDKSFHFVFSFSRSLALLSPSLALCHLCLCLALFFSVFLSFTRSLPLSNSICHLFLSPYLLLSVLSFLLGSLFCHTSRRTNHFYLIALFLQDTECSANSRSRQTGENR